MSAFESELENLLGEFHIKMKGESFVAEPAATAVHRCSLLPSSEKQGFVFVFLCIT